MTTRTQYLLFISIWVGAIVIGVIIVEGFGFSFGDDARSIRATSFIVGTVALLPAAAGFALVRGCGSVIDKWRIRRGQDIYGERSHEDEDGFIHLYEVPEYAKQHDIGVAEMVNEVADETLGYSDDSK
ncbi:MAG TPA: hypothetical protein VKC61_13370 [Pyrinomonadaceae bacterium]|nr:hypothetical protein [Pyrinomonadaceae bacterium]